MPPSQSPRFGVPARVGLLLAAVTVMALLASGCRLVTAGGASPNVTIKAQDTMRFDPPSVTVPIGQTIQFTLVNDGSLVHDFVLTEGVDQPVKVEANGKSSAGATFSVARAGSYTYICTQPGHEAAGMKGTLTAR
jgi:plastocyanin